MAKLDKKKVWEDFRKFAFKGNVMDMAVGVIIGGAFGKIVTSLVNDMIMPIFGFITAGAEFKALKWVMSEAVLDEAGKVLKPEAAILYGSFIQNIVDFIIIALSIFLMVRFVGKAMERFKKKEEEKPKKPTEAELLTEIRDLMKQQLQPAEAGVDVAASSEPEEQS